MRGPAVVGKRKPPLVLVVEDEHLIAIPVYGTALHACGNRSLDLANQPLMHRTTFLAPASSLASLLAYVSFWSVAGWYGCQRQERHSP